MYNINRRRWKGGFSLEKQRKCLQLWSMFGRRGLGEGTFFFYALNLFAGILKRGEVALRA